MEEKKNIPQIRFKGFLEEWETSKIGDFGSIAMNKRIYKNQTLEEGDVPFYKIGTFGGKADAFISKELFEEFKLKYPYPEKGNILLSASGSIGRAIEYTGERAYYQDSNIIWLKHNNRLNDKFLKHLYSIVKWNGLEGSTIKRLYNKNILDTEITIPKLKEQIKISSLFEQLDKIINLHKRKHEKLFSVKKLFLQKMFPNNGSNIPEIRFKEFTKAWEQRTFEEIFNYERPDKYIVKCDKYNENSKIPVLTANKAFILGYTDETNTYESESIIFDDFTLDSKFVDFPYMVKSSAIKILTLKNRNTDNLRFNYELLNSTKFEVLGHARHYISVVQAKEVYTTNKAEQNKIALILSKIDKLIKLYENKIEKLENIKKSLLEKMFV